MQKAVRNIDMTIEGAPDRQLSNDVNPIKISLYSNFQALAKTDSENQTKSTPKSKLLRAITKSQMFRVQSKRAELVARAPRNPTKTAPFSTK